MTVAQRPSTGWRGDAPHRAEHDRSRRTPAPPRTFRALSAWYRSEWEASLPTRMHTRGVEDGSALGSPRLAGAVARRTGHASALGWGLTGWDRHGQPIGVDAEGGTVQPFLYRLERLLRGGGTDALGAAALVTWAYQGWDLHATAMAVHHRDSASPWEVGALEAMLERTLRRLWADCQSEPVRWSVCPSCRQRACVCGQRSESQVAAEEAG